MATFAWTPYVIGARIACIHPETSRAFGGTLVRRDLEDYEGRAQWFVRWDDGINFDYSFPERELLSLG